MNRLDKELTVAAALVPLMDLTTLFLSNKIDVSSLPRNRGPRSRKEAGAAFQQMLPALGAALFFFPCYTYFPY